MMQKEDKNTEKTSNQEHSASEDNQEIQDLSDTVKTRKLLFGSIKAKNNLVKGSGSSRI